LILATKLLSKQLKRLTIQNFGCYREKEGGNHQPIMSQQQIGDMALPLNRIDQERDRDRDRDRERERQRQRERERERDRDRETETERQRETERDETRRDETRREQQEQEQVALVNQGMDSTYIACHFEAHHGRACRCARLEGRILYSFHAQAVVFDAKAYDTILRHVSKQINGVSSAVTVSKVRKRNKNKLLYRKVFNTILSLCHYVFMSIDPLLPHELLTHTTDMIIICELSDIENTNNNKRYSIV
jgi:hypothetical protein